MKEKIFSKIVEEDYNDKLEEILANKNFSEEAKNALLNIFYKIENGYKDYFTVKRDVFEKNIYIEKIINVIEKNCNEIQIVNPKNEKNEKLTKKGYIIEKDKIKCYPIDIKLLYVISRIQKNKNIIKYLDKNVEYAITRLLNIGNSMDMVEPLRDFNGFSWNTVVKEIEDIDYNLIYQNILYLTDPEFLDKWINNYSKMVDYFDLFQEKVTSNVIEKIIKLAVLLDIESNEVKKRAIARKIQKLQDQYDEILDKETYLYKLAEQKKQIEHEIKNIDKIINNKKSLEILYKKRNQELAFDKKIFSIKILKDIIEEERRKFIKNLKEINRQMSPENYLQKIYELKVTIDYLNIYNTENILKEIEKEKVNLQKDILDTFNKQIEELQEKSKFIDIIYKCRYYKLLQFDKKNKIYQVNKLKKAMDMVDLNLTKKLIEKKVILNISQNEEINLKVIKEILVTRIICLEKINIKIIKEQEDYFIQIYDEEILDKTIKLEFIEKGDFNLKLNRIYKLFI